MSVKPVTAVLGQLGLTQVRYVSPVRPRAAGGVVGRVYQQVEREFGVLAPSVALHSPAPGALAASWLMLREVLVVTGAVDRTAKEAVAATVSLGNACPWCAAIHSSTFAGLSGTATESVTDPRLRALAAWAGDCGTQDGARRHEPACSAAEAPELIGTIALLHYFNRMVNVFLTELPMPPGTPRMALGPVMQVLGLKLRPAAGRSFPPGTSLELLPAAALPGDLSWAASHPVVADAFARASSAVDAGAARSVPPAVREVVLAELGNWHGEQRGPSRAWADAAIGALPAADQAAGRLAMLTALASYQVDRSVIGEFRSGGASDAQLIELTSWASLAAARRACAWIPVGDGIPIAEASPQPAD
ncbi:MAG TPA: carboxymuconolactone decarboxylase family protein [Trebonia sp.]|jgi:AhpD family alkylhydroperoxidase|nr:carboxymuconolactone decarboxylase family protein [Trebonia sp.]